jgi:ferric-dicitrate binding protein FerR (iron transport regulator)
MRPGEQEQLEQLEQIEQLGARVGRALGEGPDEQRRALQRQALLHSLPAAGGQLRPVRRPRLAVAAVAAGVAAAAVAAGVVLAVGASHWLSTPPPMEYWIGGGAAAQAGEPGLVRSARDRTVPIFFSDGSQLDLRGATTARVVESSADRVQVDLRHGTLGARVRSRPRTRYRVVAGPFQVEDVGTVFEVRWDPVRTRLAVAVQEGVVMVGGGALAHRGVRLEAGMHLRVEGKDVHLTGPGAGPASAPARVPRDEPVPAPAPVTAPATAPARPNRRGAVPRRRSPRRDVASPQRGAGPTPAAPSGWRRAYQEGDYRAAMRRARALGLSRLARERSSDELWKLASAARYTRDAAAARLFLAAIRARFPGSRRARTAAYLLGLAAFELSADAPRAIRWFETYLREDPRGPLIEEAHGRLISACRRAGRPGPARRWARRYLARFGEGLYAGIAHAVLQEGGGRP